MCHHSMGFIVLVPWHWNSSREPFNMQRLLSGSALWFCQGRGACLPLDILSAMTVVWFFPALAGFICCTLFICQCFFCLKSCIPTDNVAVQLHGPYQQMMSVDLPLIIYIVYYFLCPCLCCFIAKINHSTHIALSVFAVSIKSTIFWK